MGLWWFIWKVDEEHSHWWIRGDMQKKNIRELKHARFWDADGNRKRTFRVPGQRFLPDFYTNHLQWRKILSNVNVVMRGQVKRENSSFPVVVCVRSKLSSLILFELGVLSSFLCYLGAMIGPQIVMSWEEWSGRLNGVKRKWGDREGGSRSSPWDMSCPRKLFLDERKSLF